MVAPPNQGFHLASWVKTEYTQMPPCEHFYFYFLRLYNTTCQAERQVLAFGQVREYSCAQVRLVALAALRCQSTNGPPKTACRPSFFVGGLCVHSNGQNMGALFLC